MLNLTPVAAAKVQEFLAHEGKAGHGLRVEVVGGGCSGFKYRLTLDGVVRDGDSIFESHGVKLVVDKGSLPYVDGTEMDYVESMEGAGFTFKNPHAQRTCGCGSSFGV